MKNRKTLIRLLSTMDDEAFSWLVLALQPSAMTAGALMQVWPDGLGGFRDRKTIEATRAAAAAWLEAEPGK